MQGGKKLNDEIDENLERFSEELSLQPALLRYFVRKAMKTIAPEKLQEHLEINEEERISLENKLRQKGISYVLREYFGNNLRKDVKKVAEIFLFLYVLIKKIKFAILLNDSPTTIMVTGPEIKEVPDIYT